MVRTLLKSSVKMPKPKETEGSEPKEEGTKSDPAIQLPQTLVRIPTEHAPMLQQNSTGGVNSE
jgi:DASH complex subunit DAD2